MDVGWTEGKSAVGSVPRMQFDTVTYDVRTQHILVTKRAAKCHGNVKPKS